MQISKHFHLKEFVKSQTAIQHRIGNMPDPAQFNALSALVNQVLEPARVALDMPLFVSSGFRSKALNELIGGAHRIENGVYIATSQHCKGEAADLQCKDNARLFSYIKENLTFDQLIWEFGDDEQPDWVHVSYTERGLNRFSVLRAVNDNGKTHYHAFV
jgi:hypothetical protein